jgi:hypothetical protein
MYRGPELQELLVKKTLELVDLVTKIHFFRNTVQT